MNLCTATHRPDPDRPDYGTDMLRRRWDLPKRIFHPSSILCAQTFRAMLVSHPPRLPSTFALGASNWKRSRDWESSVSSLILQLGEAHMVSITPTPSQNTGSPLCALSIRLTGLLFCQCTGPDPFSAVYIIKHTLQSSFLHRGLEMLSPLPRYTVTTKIFHKLDWNWQFRIQRWRLVRRLVGVWRV